MRFLKAPLRVAVDCSSEDSNHVIRLPPSFRENADALRQSCGLGDMFRGVVKTLKVPSHEYFYSYILERQGRIPSL